MTEYETRPPRHAVAATASAAPFTRGAARCLYLGTAGDVTVTYVDGDTVTHKNLAAGVWHPMEITHLTTLANSAADALIGY